MTQPIIVPPKADHLQAEDFGPVRSKLLDATKACLDAIPFSLSNGQEALALANAVSSLLHSIDKTRHL